jgi:hypothetical protein
MKEREWVECEDVEALLAFLRGKASDRKLRLFAAACARSVWHLLGDKWPRKAVRLSELLADSLATEEEHRKAVEAAGRLGNKSPPGEWAPGKVALWRLAHDAARASLCPPGPGLRGTVVLSAVAADDQALREEVSHRPCDLLRDIFGPLAFRPVTVAPAVLAWGDGVARHMAEGIYEERAFDRLPILADALEDAGCADAELLGHLRRSDVPHVRGCWGVDAVLQKS